MFDTIHLHKFMVSLQLGDYFLLFCFWYLKIANVFDKIGMSNKWNSKDAKTSSIHHFCLAMRNSMTYLLWYLALGAPSYFRCTLGTNVHISCLLLSSVKMAYSRRRVCKNEHNYEVYVNIGHLCVLGLMWFMFFMSQCYNNKAKWRWACFVILLESVPAAMVSDTSRSLRLPNSRLLTVGIYCMYLVWIPIQKACMHLKK